MKIAIFGKPFDNKLFEKIGLLFFELIKNDIELIIYKPFEEFIDKNINIGKDHPVFSDYNDLPNDTDLLFSIGGDGTFLQALTMIKEKDIPVLGINTGRLGFLSIISQDDIKDTVEAIVNKNYTIEKRSMLQLVTDSALFSNYDCALNDITVQKKGTTLITIHTYINNEFLNSYWADGLIIATPTGSTAYSLSVGGPIVSPSLGCFIISPIAPHNLSVRPFVLSDEYEISIEVESRNSNFFVSLDHVTKIFESNSRILVKKAKNKINILKLENTSFYKTIRNKLMWGLDKRN